MIYRLTAFVLGFHVITAAADGAPTIDFQATCRASVRAVFDAVGNTTAATLDICIKQEESARAEMDRDWTTYPAADKEQCVHPKQFSPSYVEWLTCLENRREARKLPKQ